MTLRTPWSATKSALMFGVVLLAIHSLLAVAMFLYVYSQRGIAQGELAWAVFSLFDLPISLILFPWLSSGLSVGRFWPEPSYICGRCSSRWLAVVSRRLLHWRARFGQVGCAVYDIISPKVI